MKYDPFENREDVDHEHVIKVGSVTVFFLKKVMVNHLMKLPSCWLTLMKRE